MSSQIPLARPAHLLINDASDAIASARHLCRAISLIAEGMLVSSEEDGNAVASVAHRALDELERAKELLSAARSGLVAAE